MKSVGAAFADVLKETRPRKPLYVQTDKGTEFMGKAFSDLLKKNSIQFFTTENKDIKASIVERFQRTLQECIHRLFTATHSERFVDELQNIVTSYNRTYHRSIRMTPREALDERNAERVWVNLYESEERKNK